MPFLLILLFSDFEKFASQRFVCEQNSPSHTKLLLSHIHVSMCELSCQSQFFVVSQRRRRRIEESIIANGVLAIPSIIIATCPSSTIPLEVSRRRALFIQEYYFRTSYFPGTALLGSLFLLPKSKRPLVTFPTARRHFRQIFFFLQYDEAQSRAFFIFVILLFAQPVVCPYLSSVDGLCRICKLSFVCSLSVDVGCHDGSFG